MIAPLEDDLLYLARRFRYGYEEVLRMPWSRRKRLIDEDDRVVRAAENSLKNKGRRK